jgi:hypothetical protein
MLKGIGSLLGSRRSGQQSRRWRGVLPLLAVALLAFVPPAAASPSSPTVYGKTIGDWGLAWWQWAIDSTAANNPITSDGAVDCSAGQSGRVWFLAGTFGTTAVRSCSVPASKALFLAIYNTLWWNPEDCKRPLGCRRTAAEQMDNITSWTCRIDGRPCIFTNQVVRDQSNPLPLNIPPYSWLVTEVGYTPGLREFAIADGYWIMLDPLPAGPHTIRITTTAPGGFALDVTFNLTVTP